jgi:3-oxoadipate enol-lactonase
MPYFNHDGCNLYYEVDAKPGLPTLVLSNALGTNLSLWEPQIAVFRGRFTIVRYDGRGHGRSSVSAGPYTIDQLGGDVVALMDHLELASASFCGLSMGGLVGQWLGIHATQRLRKLVICNTAAKIGTEASWNERIRVVRANGMETIIPAVVERWFTPQFRSAHPEALLSVSALLAAANRDGYVANCAAIRDGDLRGDLHQIKAPTLVVFGRHDPVTTPEDARFLAERITNAETLPLDAAHLSNIEAAESFRAGVLDFLSHGDTCG